MEWNETVYECKKADRLTQSRFAALVGSLRRWQGYERRCLANVEFFCYILLNLSLVVDIKTRLETLANTSLSLADGTHCKTKDFSVLLGYDEYLHVWTLWRFYVDDGRTQTKLLWCRCFRTTSLWVFSEYATQYLQVFDDDKRVLVKKAHLATVHSWLFFSAM